MNAITHLTGGLALAGALAGCFPPPPPPPIAGYGAPYKGTGEGIYVKDSRNDWDITEGHHKITSEQALEAAGDPEYEARRQIAKAYNDRLVHEAEAHHRRAYHMMIAGAAAIVVGAIVYGAGSRLQQESVRPGAIDMPEMRTFHSGLASEAATNTGAGLVLIGLAGIPYAYFGGLTPPPYHVWHTSPPLFRPAYVRQQVEPYNEKIGAPTIPDEQIDPAKLSLPGKPAPAKHLPRPRGGK